MSKLGRKPIQVPAGVEITKIENNTALKIKGKEGELQIPLLEFVSLEVDDSGVMLGIDSDKKQARANWGTMAAILKNALEGVTKKFEKNLIIEGVGFRAKMEGTTLVLNVGFSHQVKFPAPDGVIIETEKSNIKITGINKELVGQTAAKIRKIKKPEPYKGKGIRYKGEVIRRKAGKKAVGTGAA